MSPHAGDVLCDLSALPTAVQDLQQTLALELNWMLLAESSGRAGTRVIDKRTRAHILYLHRDTHTFTTLASPPAKSQSNCTPVSMSVSFVCLVKFVLIRSYPRFFFYLIYDSLARINRLGGDANVPSHGTWLWHAQAALVSRSAAQSDTQLGYARAPHGTRRHRASGQPQRQR